MYYTYTNTTFDIEHIKSMHNWEEEVLHMSWDNLNPKRKYFISHSIALHDMPSHRDRYKNNKHFFPRTIATEWAETILFTNNDKVIQLRHCTTLQLIEEHITHSHDHIYGCPNIIYIYDAPFYKEKIIIWYELICIACTYKKIRT